LNVAQKGRIAARRRQKAAKARRTWPEGAYTLADTDASLRGSSDPETAAQGCEAPAPDGQAPAEEHAAAPRSRHSGFWGIALGSIGVVFGDIGTSPLYAFQAALGQATRNQAHDPVTPASIIGVVSLALWALLLVVTLKYVLFVMRADNKGEGGVLSLMALVQRALGRRTTAIFFLGVVGAALFYGDAIITPAISVLGAFQGMNDVPALKAVTSPHFITLISMVILFGLFMTQARGTASIAKLFAPVMLVWFVVIAALGLYHILDDPRVLWALSPHYAAIFMASHKLTSFLVLGSVFLTVTGAEALYADMGHFGRWPIQASWLFFALPCLLLNYFGQGAYALKALAEATRLHREFVNQDWFFVMAPAPLRAPVVMLAVCASIIASQAVITGAYSLSQQGVLLGLLPRMDVRRTSETHTGQIYMPQINSLLMVGVLLLVAMFQSSDNLADAYGLAVTGTMLVTTILAYIVARRMWRWRAAYALLLVAPLITLDLVFLIANGLKIASGGWVPLLIGASLFLVMWTWVRGSQILTDKTRREAVPLAELIEMLRARPPHRVPGTAIFLTSDVEMAPVALMHNLKHNKVLHEKNLIATVRIAETPRVSEAHRIQVTPINETFKTLVIQYGFMERPNLPKALALCRKQGVKFDIMATSFFLGRRSVVPAAQTAMPLWQDKLYIYLLKNAANPTEFFRIPPGRVVELGAQISV
jgi:KUP system potassium uptake protein